MSLAMQVGFFFSLNLWPWSTMTATYIFMFVFFLGGRSKKELYSSYTAKYLHVSLSTKVIGKELQGESKAMGILK